jgi:hypothetical protein
MSDENLLPSSEFGTPFYALVEHFSAKGFKFQADIERRLLTLGISGETAEYNCALYLTHDDEVLQIQIDIPVSVRDAKQQPLAAEFVARANNRLVIGRFDFDHDQGRLRFHVGHPFGEKLDDETISRLMGTALATADRYFPALMRALFGGHTPADAIFLAELDYPVEEGESSKEEPAPPSKRASAPVAPPKKARRACRNTRSKSTKDLPGLFDQGAGDQKEDPGQT